MQTLPRFSLTTCWVTVVATSKMSSGRKPRKIANTKNSKITYDCSLDGKKIPLSLTEALVTNRKMKELSKIMD